MLITDRERILLLRNGARAAFALSRGDRPRSVAPVVRLIASWAESSIYLAELATDGRRLFGLFDWAGTLEFGSIDLRELQQMVPSIQRDESFVPVGTLSDYAEILRARARETMQ